MSLRRSIVFRNINDIENANRNLISGNELAIDRGNGRSKLDISRAAGLRGAAPEKKAISGKQNANANNACQMLVSKPKIFT